MTGALPPSDRFTLRAVDALLSTRGLHLLRAWPRSEQHLLLEATTGRCTVAGQWFASLDRAAEVARETPEAEQLGAIVQQPGGADRRLTGLPSLLRREGAVLVAHRAERRAVVRLPGSVPGAGAAEYLKVVRRSALPTVAGTARAAARLPLRTPGVVRVDAEASAVVMEALPGQTLHVLLATTSAVGASRAAGRALAALHRAPMPVGLRRHDEADEHSTGRRWQQLAQAHGLAPAFRVPQTGGTQARTSDEPDLVLLHRDFHDKQVVVDDDGDVGVLDFDLMAIGAPTVDLANFLVHLDLRAVQGLVADAGPLRAAVLEGYQPTETQLTQLSRREQATWERLAAIYAFRPPQSTT